MKQELQFILTLLISGILSVPIVPNVDQRLNEIDHGEMKDRKSEHLEATIVPEFNTSDREGNLALRPRVSWLLSPIVQKIHFTPQSLLQDRLSSLKNALGSFGQQPNVTTKSLPNTFLQMLGLSEADLLYNSIDPAGFLAGNGWFANKGGLLGGPGAIVSTGSLLTDYPTAY